MGESILLIPNNLIIFATQIIGAVTAVGFLSLSHAAESLSRVRDNVVPHSLMRYLVVVLSIDIVVSPNGFSDSTLSCVEQIIYLIIHIIDLWLLLPTRPHAFSDRLV